MGRSTMHSHDGGRDRSEFHALDHLPACQVRGMKTDNRLSRAECMRLIAAVDLLTFPVTSTEDTVEKPNVRARVRAPDTTRSLKLRVGIMTASFVEISSSFKTQATCQHGWRELVVSSQCLLNGLSVATGKKER
jgi:hypothetical protein